MSKFNRKKTILQVLPALFSGGVERGTVEISKAIVDNGMRSIVVSSGGTYSAKISEHGGMHITIPTINSKNPFTIYKNIGILEQIMITHDVDLIHARSRAPAWSCYLAAKKCKVPFVTTYHGTYSQNFFKTFYNSVMTKGNKVIAVSNYIKDYINDYHKGVSDKIEVIPRGVDLEYFNPESVPIQRIMNVKSLLGGIPDNKLILTLPGRITRWKGHMILLKALKQIDNHDFFVVIVGDSKGHKDYFKELKNFVANNNLTDCVRFASHVKDMPAIYSLSDVIIVPSTRPEAFGRVVTEAQAMKKIVVASDIGGAAETIIDGETGFNFKSENTEDLAKILMSISEMPNDWKWRITENARKNIMENYSLEQMQSKTIEIYKTLLKI